MSTKTFHLGLCMAGSVSAGAYTAGVMDYLMEALQAWEEARGSDPSIPDHRVEIDLLGGASGGGITAAMAFFALRHKFEHAHLEADGRTYKDNPEGNIFWNAWVNLTGNDVFEELLDTSDIQDYHIPSAVNAMFIDKVAGAFKTFVEGLPPSKAPPFLSGEAEMFMTLFNVTGMKYRLSSRAIGATEQYISEHRDLAHFRWSDQYEGDGRMEVSFGAQDNLPALIEAAKATGAFPIGLKARILQRRAKYIWDNPFFRKNNKFDRRSIDLGMSVRNEEDIYQALIADGGTSNNEPVELMRDLMVQIRLREQQRLAEMDRFNRMDDTDKMVEKSRLLHNSTVVLIDPFPSYDFDVVAPTGRSEHIFTYGLDLTMAMRSQLLFDAKEAVDAYDKDNYGLHIVAPSREGAEKPEYAIACGALGGFGGFLSREYRVHDYFLGRHNCQSFIRRYLVVDPDEKPVDEQGRPNENYACVKAVLEGYGNEAAARRFAYTDERGKRRVPIIPDVTLKQPFRVEVKEVGANLRKLVYEGETGVLPLYQMKLPKGDFLEAYRNKIEKRINKLMNNVHDSNWMVDGLIRLAANRLDDKAADQVINRIRTDLEKRKLIEG